MSDQTVLEVSGLEVVYSTNKGDVKAVQELDLRSEEHTSELQSPI